MVSNYAGSYTVVKAEAAAGGGSTGWWQDLVARADLILCVNKKIPFATAAGEQGTAFPIGSTLVAIGEQGVRGLLTAHRNGLGILLKPVPVAEYIHNPLAEAAE